jgi:putative mRNA 3-end processing factor
MDNNLLHFTKKGIYCPQADIYIDPWGGVEKAVITHAHSDHARFGNKYYLAHKQTVPVLKYRLGSSIKAKGIEYDETLDINGVKLSLHPAGHMIGSAQVRLEYKGEIAVVSGDYKLQDDGISAPFEIIKCNTFITESTFGLPIYKWKEQKEIVDEVNNWWRGNVKNGKASVLMGYALGKSQRLLNNLDSSIGKIYAHGAVQNLNDIFIKEGIALPIAERVISARKADYRGAMILAPSSVMGSPWLKRFEPYSIANASGWMAVRGSKRWMSVDRGFAISDHADWNGLNEAVELTGAEKIYVTHGFTEVFVKWLREKGYDAQELKTKFVNEGEESMEPEAEEIPLNAV